MTAISTALGKVITVVELVNASDVRRVKHWLQILMRSCMIIKVVSVELQLQTQSVVVHHRCATFLRHAWIL